jgi:hypothetical protein
LFWICRIPGAGCRWTDAEKPALVGDIPVDAAALMRAEGDR